MPGGLTVARAGIMAAAGFAHIAGIRASPGTRALRGDWQRDVRRRPGSHAQPAQAITIADNFMSGTGFFASTLSGIVVLMLEKTG